MSAPLIAVADSEREPEIPRGRRASHEDAESESSAKPTQLTVVPGLVHSTADPGPELDPAAIQVLRRQADLSARLAEARASVLPALPDADRDATALELDAMDVGLAGTTGVAEVAEQAAALDGLTSALDGILAAARDRIASYEAEKRRAKAEAERAARLAEKKAQALANKRAYDEAIAAKRAAAEQAAQELARVEAERLAAQRAAEALAAEQAAEQQREAARQEADRKAKQAAALKAQMDSLRRNASVLAAAQNAIAGLVGAQRAHAVAALARIRDAAVAAAASQAAADAVRAATVQDEALDMSSFKDKPAPKRRGGRKVPVAKTATPATDPARPSPDEAYAAGVTSADRDAEESTATSTAAYASLVHAAPDVAATDIVWVITASGGDISAARPLMQLLKRTGGGAVARQIATQSDIPARANLCMSLLDIDPASATVAKDADALLGIDRPLRTWVLDLVSHPPAGTAVSVNDAVRFVQRHDGAPVALQIGAVLGVAPGHDPLIAALVRMSPPESSISWLTQQRPATYFVPLCQAIASHHLALPLVQEVFLGRGTLGADAIVLLLSEFPKRLAEMPRAVRYAADKGSIDIAHIWLSTSLTDPNDACLRAIMGEAELRAGRAPVGWEKADTAYKKGGLGARTGFLTLTVGGRECDLHTHWSDKTTERRLTSAHVKVGKGNEFEINNWSEYFPRLLQAMVTVHNAHLHREDHVSLPLPK